jgi:hypothetical protein
MSACAMRSVPPSVVRTQLASALPPSIASIRKAAAVYAATSTPIRPTESTLALSHIAELEEKRRSVSATLRRLRSEQEVILADQRREREIKRLEARLCKAAVNRLPLDCLSPRGGK